MGNCTVQGKVPVSSTLTNWLQGSKWQSLSLRHLWVMGISSGKLTSKMLLIFLLHFYFCAHFQYLLWVSWKLHLHIFQKNLCFIVKWKWLRVANECQKAPSPTQLIFILFNLSPFWWIKDISVQSNPKHIFKLIHQKEEVQIRFMIL